jgi:hypothetical protein
MTALTNGRTGTWRKGAAVRVPPQGDAAAGTELRPLAEVVVEVCEVVDAVGCRNGRSRSVLQRGELTGRHARDGCCQFVFLALVRCPHRSRVARRLVLPRC